MVPSGAPVDQYVIHHPEFLLEGAPEEARLDPDNLPRNSSWRMVWTSGPTTYFVDMNTFEPTGVKFEYGALDANGIFQTQGAADKKMKDLGVMVNAGGRVPVDDEERDAVLTAGAGQPRHLVGLIGAHAIQYFLVLLSWWMIGRGALEGRLEVTAVPYSLAVRVPLTICPRIGREASHCMTSPFVQRRSLERAAPPAMERTTYSSYSLAPS